MTEQNQNPQPPQQETPHQENAERPQEAAREPEAPVERYSPAHAPGASEEGAGTRESAEPQESIPPEQSPPVQAPPEQALSEQPPAANRPDWASRGVSSPGAPDEPARSEPIQGDGSGTSLPDLDDYRSGGFDGMDIPEEVDTTTGFSAMRDMVELSYNFAPHLDERGVIPEPSEARLDKWREAEIKAMEAANERTQIQTVKTDEEGNQIVDGQALMQALSVDRKSRRMLLDATVDLCNGSPSRRALYALPPRVFIAFYSWLRGELGEV